MNRCIADVDVVMFSVCVASMAHLPAPERGIPHVRDLSCFFYFPERTFSVFADLVPRSKVRSCHSSEDCKAR